MKTVIDNVTEIVVNKSRFITYIYKVDNIDYIDEILKQIKKEHKDATHYCYAYIIDNNVRFNDDGEPSGTAGLPILNVLKKEKLNHVLCIVVRYFGGIKLGSGGLIRAYTKACKEDLKIIELKEGYEIKISFDYDKVKEFDYLLKDYIVDKSFDEQISYSIKINKEDFLLIEDKIKSYIIYSKNTFI